MVFLSVSYFSISLFEMFHNYMFTSSFSITHLTSRGSPRQLRIEDCAAVRKASKAAVHVTQGEAMTAGEVTRWAVQPGYPLVI